MNRRGFLQSSGAAVVSGRLDVVEQGASGDGRTLNTKPLQAAIDACAARGGGVVYFPPGRYVSGTLILRSNVRLYLEAGATLLGSTRLSDYPSMIPAFRSYTDNYTEKSLIYAEKVENITIEGRGAIDGQGAAFPGPYKVRPYLIRVISCRNIAMADITLRDSPMWLQHYLDCDGVSIRGITVHNWANRNGDGIDIDCCDRVRISDCDFSSLDDAITLKSTAGRPCRHVVVTNCVVTSGCNAIKLGTESNGGFENIVISNCAIYDTRLAGIALEIVDGGTLDRVTVSNITMNTVGAPVFVRLGDRARPFLKGGAPQPVGRLRNVQIRGVQATHAGPVGCSITGLPGHVVEDISLEDIRLRFAGGGTEADSARDVPENAQGYPEFKMFGTLPAYALYCRHVQGLRLRDLDVRCDARDDRPALVCDDVEDLDTFNLEGINQAGPVVRLRDVRGARIRGSRAGAGTRTWLRVEGARSRDIGLNGNDFRQAERAYEADATVPGGVVSLSGGS
ncbi:MAG: glycoside hydrolase family 28 protein [Bryobacteraceae bacterium]